jgi:AMP-binding enzyme
MDANRGVKKARLVGDPVQPDGDPIAKGAPVNEVNDAPHLKRNPANFAALTPLGFLARAAAIYPDKLAVIEVEEVLYRHPMVMEAAVVARPDPTWGETPCTFVALKPDAGEVRASDIIAWCRTNLAHYKVPKSIVFGPLPKTSTDNIQKYALRERARETRS